MPQPPQTAEYGFWRSPITSDLVASASVRLGQIAVAGEDIYWVEGRPAEKGRNVLVRRAPDGRIADVTPPPFNVRTRVHEYGGGAFCVHGSTVYFSNDDDGRVYRKAPGQEPGPVTPEGAWRYADFIVDSSRQRLVCVREDHSEPGKEPVNTVVAVGLSGGQESGVLIEGSDFYSNPRLSPDGSRLAWLSWNHPNMPWDGTELWVAEIDAEGRVGGAEKVAGGENESVFQPEWSPSGELYFVSDRRGWWNLYRGREAAVEPVIAMEAEFGLPQWVFGQSTYAFQGGGAIVCAYRQNNIWQLATVTLSTNTLKKIESPYNDISDMHASGDLAVFRGGSPSQPPSIVALKTSRPEPEVLGRSFAIADEFRDYLSVPEPIEFPTANDVTAHAFFYPPSNPDYRPPSDEKPPLIVISHGGPTGSASTTLSLAVQYWTSRGFAVVDVNYGGSTGYGRAYRERLRGQWGVVDVDDCVNAARYLVERGIVDGDRLIIRGGSAGGYTTLAALAFRNVFRAGASYYGVSDIEALMRDTHKFESRYDRFLVGPYPEQKDLFAARSPIHAVERLNVPVIFFQGAEDKVVPPNQAERMVEALREKGVPTAYLLFEGEQHGFRQADNIRRALDAELYFYAVVMLRKGLRF